MKPLGVGFRGGKPGVGDAQVIADGQKHRLPFRPAALLKPSYLGMRDKASFGALFAKLAKLKANEWVDKPASELLDGLRPCAAHVVGLAIRTST